MLRQRHQENENSEIEQLRKYLDDLQKPMAALGEEEQQEWRDEAMSHLLCLIVAYEELGDTHEEAVRAALARFGEPKVIGTRVSRAAQAQQNPVLRISNCIMNCGGAFFLPTMAAFMAFVLMYDFMDNLSAQSLAYKIVVSILWMGPILSGWLLGRRMPWLREETQRVRVLMGAKGIARLKFVLAFAAAATSLELGLFWALIRTLGAGEPARFLPADLIPAMAWLPIVLGVAHWQERRTRKERS